MRAAKFTQVIERIPLLLSYPEISGYMPKLLVVLPTSQVSDPTDSAL